MLKITESLRPKSLIPPYPNYHKGDYFEEFFFKRFFNDFKNCEINSIKYIPIFWTNCYTNKVFTKKSYNIQNILDTLNNDELYFTISQHDDCIYEVLPKNTIIFSMGGNKVSQNIIPIPLICSSLNYPKLKKDINISFVGSLTHPIRNKILQEYYQDKDFLFITKEWQLKNTQNEINLFQDIMSRSVFTLSPRGYGKTSFRLYESMQLDSIPVYVSDYHWLPWKNEIEWNNLVITIEEDEIRTIKERIQNTDIVKFNQYKNSIFNDYFTYEGVYKNILKILKKW